MADPLIALVFDSLIAHGLVILVIVFVLEGLVIGKLLPTEAVLVAAILLFSPDPSLTSLGIIVLSAKSRCSRSFGPTAAMSS